MKTPIGCTTSSFSAAWKSNTMLGMFPYDSFDADYGMNNNNNVRCAAQAFWKRVMDHPFISKELQELATRMSGRMGCF
jgi:hypothetical protein